MLNKQGFNAWAQSYEKKVYTSYKEDVYPFSGYYDVLFDIYQTVIARKPKRVLDIGVGTGLLTTLIYNEHIRIYGMDFSEAMIKQAKTRMYNAILKCYDMHDGLHPDLKQETYDAIISTYTMHHLPVQKQIDFIISLKDFLTPSGVIIIGDIMFKNQSHKAKTMADAGDAWDDEHYLIYDAIKENLPPHTYKQISACAGILIFS